MSVCLRIQPLLGGDVTSAPVGEHVVLEAPGGQLLHAIRVPDGLCALRSGSVRQFQVARSLPAAASVCYPPPFDVPTEAERRASVDRTTRLLGLGAAEVARQLEGAGVEGCLAAGGNDAADAVVAECLASFCATGIPRWWKVSEAYRASKSSPSSHSSAASSTRASSGSSGISVGSMSQLQAQCHASSVASSTSQAPPHESSVASSPIASPYGGCGEGGTPSVSRITHWEAHASSPTSTTASSPSPVDAGRTDGAQLPSMPAGNPLQHKAIETAVHCGLRGPAARAAGAAAAIGLEGYGLYCEVKELDGQRESKNISGGQYEDKVAESAVTAGGRTMGGLAGAAIGQAAIPVPVVGAVLGGVVGAAAGGLHASSLVSGALRLTGNRNKGGDDLVRCIEHHPRNNEAPGRTATAGMASPPRADAAPVTAAWSHAAQEEDEPYL